MKVWPDVEAQRHDNVLILSVTGEIDISNVDILRERLTERIANEDLGVVIDFSTVSYVDSSGLNLVFSLSEQLSHRQQTLVLVMPEDAVIYRVAAAVNLPAIVPLYETSKEAVQHVLRAHTNVEATTLNTK